MPDPSATERSVPTSPSATSQAEDWCGQCVEYGGHKTNRCPVGVDVRCLTHDAWMKRGASRCEAPIAWMGRHCKAAS